MVTSREPDGAAPRRPESSSRPSDSMEPLANAAQQNRSLVFQDAEREAFGQVELYVRTVVRGIADGQVLPDGQLVVATACREQHRALAQGGRPDQRAVFDPLFEALAQRI